MSRNSQHASATSEIHGWEKSQHKTKALFLSNDAWNSAELHTSDPSCCTKMGTTGYFQSSTAAWLLDHRSIWWAGTAILPRFTKHKKTPWYWDAAWGIHTSQISFYSDYSYMRVVCITCSQEARWSTCTLPETWSCSTEAISDQRLNAAIFCIHSVCLPNRLLAADSHESLPRHSKIIPRESYCYSLPVFLKYFLTAVPTDNADVAAFQEENDGLIPWVSILPYQVHSEVHRFLIFFFLLLLQKASSTYVWRQVFSSPN